MSRYSLDYSRFDDLEVSSDEEPPIGVPGYIPLDVDGPITGLSAFDDPNREGYEDFMQRKERENPNYHILGRADEEEDAKEDEKEDIQSDKEAFLDLVNEIKTKNTEQEKNATQKVGIEPFKIRKITKKQPKIEKIKKEVQLKEENIIQTVHKAKLTNKEKYSIDYSRWDNMEVTDDVETSLDSGNDVPFFPKQEEWIEEDMEEYDGDDSISSDEEEYSNEKKDLDQKTLKKLEELRGSRFDSKGNLIVKKKVEKKKPAIIVKEKIKKENKINTTKKNNMNKDKYSSNYSRFDQIYISSSEDEDEEKFNKKNSESEISKLANLDKEEDLGIASMIDPSKGYPVSMDKIKEEFQKYQEDYNTLKKTHDKKNNEIEKDSTFTEEKKSPTTAMMGMELGQKSLQGYTMGMKKKKKEEEEEEDDEEEDNILFLKEDTWTVEEEQLILINVLKPNTKFAKENPKIILEGAKSNLHRHPFWKERGQNKTSRSEYERELNNVLKGALRGDLAYEMYIYQFKENKKVRCSIDEIKPGDLCTVRWSIEDASEILEFEYIGVDEEGSSMELAQCVCIITGRIGEPNLQYMIDAHPNEFWSMVVNFRIFGNCFPMVFFKTSKIFSKEEMKPCLETINSLFRQNLKYFQPFYETLPSILFYSGSKELVETEM